MPIKNGGPPINEPESESEGFSQEAKDFAASDKTLKELFEERARAEEAKKAELAEKENPQKISELKAKIERGSEEMPGENSDEGTAEGSKARKEYERVAVELADINGQIQDEKKRLGFFKSSINTIFRSSQRGGQHPSQLSWLLSTKEKLEEQLKQMGSDYKKQL